MTVSRLTYGASLLLLLPITVTSADPGWAVITGASSGIGRELARQAAASGFSVVGAARSDGALQSLGKELTEGYGVRFERVSCDLSTTRCHESLRQATEHLNVTLLVANAGFAIVGDLISLPLAQMQSLLDLNLGSTMKLCRLYASDFATRRHGRILITGSLVGMAPLPGALLYGASKSFLRSFAFALRQELAPASVSVTILSPGATSTGFAAAGDVEGSLAFTIPLGRASGFVLSAESVAAEGLRAALAGEAEAVPGFLNRAYVRAATWFMPTALSASFSAVVFDPRRNPLTSFEAFRDALPSLVCTTPLLMLSIVIEAISAVAQALWRTTFGCLIIVLLLITGVNILQNGPTPVAPPVCTTVEHVMALRRKQDFVAAWRAGKVPQGYEGNTFDAKLTPLGIAAPMSSLITNVLFGPFSAWRGKVFSQDGRTGLNRFGSESFARAFGARIGPSAFDSKPALVLDYSQVGHGDRFWGGVLGMRDEIREIAPGLLLGLGSMLATGGVRNCSPFVLHNPRVLDARAPGKSE